MSFFKKLYSLFSLLGFILFLITSIFITYLLINKDYKHVLNNVDVEIYQENKVNNISFYLDVDTLNINVEFKNELSQKENISYAYYYFDNYKYKINMLSFNLNKTYLITIDLNGKSCLFLNQTT